VTQDPVMLRILENADAVASSRAPVLIEGESGTGKELLARHLHERGIRRDRSFVVIDCAAPPRLDLGGFAGLTVREMERRLIVDTLERTRNNRTHAAKLLGISIRTLRNKLAEYRARGELALALESET
jgi:DNA-binding NtrC family response regulator